MTKPCPFVPPPTPPVRTPTVHAPPPVAQRTPLPGTVKAGVAPPPVAVRAVAGMSRRRWRRGNRCRCRIATGRPAPLLCRRDIGHALNPL